MYGGSFDESGTDHNWLVPVDLSNDVTALGAVFRVLAETSADQPGFEDRLDGLGTLTLEQESQLVLQGRQFVP